MSNICTALVQSGILDMTYSVNIFYNKSTSTLYAAVFYKLNTVNSSFSLSLI